MNLLEVGAILKRERERCGITIRDVMDATKISRRNLSALEEGQVSALPHPVYLKGYVRNIAKMVGLDADELAQAVDQQYDADLGKYLPQVASAPATAQAPAHGSSGGAVDPAAPLDTAPAPQPEPISRPTPKPAPEPEREARPRTAPEPLTPPKRKKPGSVGSIVVLALLVAGLVALLVQYQRMYSAAPPAPPAPVVESAPAAANASAQDNASEALANATASANQTDEAAAPSVPAAPSAPEAPRAAPAPAPVTSVPATSIEVSRKPAPASQIMQAPTPGMQQLTIAAKPDEVCWVQVSDGKEVKSFTLHGGETRQVEFAKRLRVRLGNAGGVSFRLNGRDYPYEGKRGNIDTVEFGER